MFWNYVFSKLAALFDCVLWYIEIVGLFFNMIALKVWYIMNRNSYWLLAFFPGDLLKVHDNDVYTF